MLSRTRAHASHPLNGIVGGGMLWCALALLVSQPPQPCLGYAQRKKPPRTQPPTRPPLEGGTTRWRRPPCQSFYARPRTHGREVAPCNAVPRYVMICYDMPCEAVLCSATLCYDVLLGERIGARLVL